MPKRSFVEVVSFCGPPKRLLAEAGCSLGLLKILLVDVGALSGAPNILLDGCDFCSPNRLGEGGAWFELPKMLFEFCAGG